MKKYKFDIWDVIIISSLIILTLYVILKLFRIIYSPEWLNLLPIITIIFFAGAFYQKIIAFIERMYHRTDYFKVKIDNIDNKLSNHEERIIKVESKIKVKRFPKPSLSPQQAAGY